MNIERELIQTKKQLYDAIAEKDEALEMAERLVRLRWHEADVALEELTDHQKGLLGHTCSKQESKFLPQWDLGSSESLSRSTSPTTCSPLMASLHAGATEHQGDEGF